MGRNDKEKERTNNFSTSFFNVVSQFLLIVMSWLRKNISNTGCTWFIVEWNLVHFVATKLINFINLEKSQRKIEKKKTFIETWMRTKETKPQNNQNKTN